MGEPYDLGVLVVHGIGGQRRGDTLRSVGGSLVESLRDWLGEDAVVLRDITPLPGRVGEPAHGTVWIQRDGHVKRVLIAESWWAETFRPPGWWEFAGWLVWGVPFVVFRASDHGISVIDTNEKLDDARSSHRWRDRLRVPWYIAVRLLKNVLSVVVVVFLVAALLVAGIVAIFPPLRRWILSWQRLLIRYLGDSHCLLASHECGQATVSQVREDLSWLEERMGGGEVAIIAHSQGAELARRVLERRDAGPPIASLITFGSGIAKLRAVRRLHAQRWKALGAYLVRTLAAPLTVAGPLLWVLADVSVPFAIVVTAATLVLAGLLITWARGRLMGIVRADLLADELRAAVGPEQAQRWLDFYATSDAVPEGALPLEKLELPASSTRIANYRSVVRDHASYVRNGEAFRPAVLAELARLLGWTPPPPAMVVIHNSRERRERKTLALVSDRLVIAASAIAVVLLPYVFDVGRERAEDVVDWLHERAGWMAQWFGEEAERWVAAEPGRYVVAGAALVLAACTLYGAGALAWAAAARKRQRRLFTPSRPPGTEPLGETMGFVRRFTYGQIAKHADKVDREHGWPAHPRRLPRLMPRVRGGFVLFGLRQRLREENLYDTAAPDPPERVKFTPRPLTRTLDGRGTDLCDRDMGAAGTYFGRNAPAFPARGLPSAKEVSDRLLARRDNAFLPATSLNLLAAAWVQFEVHDWMQHKLHPQRRPPRRGRAAPVDAGMQPSVATGEPRADAPRFISEQTHWWDASQLYGVDARFTDSLRDGDRGRVKTGRELLNAIEAWVFRTPAPVPNFWLGLALFHELFAREHNAICDALEEAEPQLEGEVLFDKARLINAAVMAKVHTVEWTPAVVAHPTPAHAILATWWGVLGPRTRRLVGRIGRGEVLSGIPGSPTHHDGVRYSLTEEFAAVYRMHPLIPDTVTFRAVRDRGKLGTFEFSELAVGAGPASRPRDRLGEIGDFDNGGFENALYSLAVECPGRITLHNYPTFLRQLPMPSGDPLDLAERDIERMREAALPLYNDFRRLFRLRPVQSFVELTGGDRLLADEIEAVYGSLEKVDLMVGLFAEPVPDGLAFSDTAFRVFLLMAARRLRSDRFFTTDFTPAVYTRAGYRWVQGRTMKQMLAHHFPALLPALDRVDNVFTPWHEVA